MDELLETRPAVGGTLLQTILPQIADGTLAALPVTLFLLAEGERAFRLMAQARHIGKIVLSLPPAANGGCAIVSGGFGGLGPPVAAWLQATGFRTVVLTGRGDPSAATLAAIDSVRTTEATIVCDQWT